MGLTVATADWIVELGAGVGAGLASSLGISPTAAGSFFVGAVLVLLTGVTGKPAASNFFGAGALGAKPIAFDTTARIATVVGCAVVAVLTNSAGNFCTRPAAVLAAAGVAVDLSGVAVLARRAGYLGASPLAI